MDGNSKGFVVIIEDEVPLLESYAEILKQLGYDVMTADNGYKGLEVLAQNKEKAAVVVLDLMMPGINGLDVLRKIRAKQDEYGNPQVIVLTNMTNEGVIKEAFIVGANSYLMKTELEADDLGKEVGKYMEVALDNAQSDLE